MTGSPITEQVTDLRRQLEELKAENAQWKASQAKREARERANGVTKMIDSTIAKIEELDNEVRKLPEATHWQVKGVYAHNDDRSESWKNEEASKVKDAAHQAINAAEQQAAGILGRAWADLEKIEHEHQPTGLDLAVKTMQETEARQRIRALLDQGNSLSSIVDRAVKVGDIPMLEALRAEHAWQTADTPDSEVTRTAREHLDRAAAPVLPPALGKARVARYDLHRAYERFTATVEGARGQLKGDSGARLRTALRRHYA